MNDFNQTMLVVAYIGVALVIVFLIWLSVRKTDEARGLAYAIECKNKGISPKDTRKLVAHYLEWDVKVCGRNGNSQLKIATNAKEMAEKFVSIAFYGERTRENTKPRIRIPADIE